MEQPLRIIYRDILPEHKDALDPIIREHAAKMDKYFPNIISCHVVMEKASSAAPRGRSLQNDDYPYCTAQTDCGESRAPPYTTVMRTCLLR